jgi:hypothetical protein
MGARTNE